ncbi:spinster family MFS transporter [Aromatoleum petrolei]|nr:MFS transporter [Aromatoleum petrolei]
MSHLGEGVGIDKKTPWQERSWYRWYALGLLTLVYVLHFVDRTVVFAILEPIKHEFDLTDTQLGFYSGLVHSLPYALAGIPMGMLADRVNRRNLLAVIIIIWSGLTALSGVAQSFLFLVVARLCVGAAEAGGTPSAMSMLADLFSLRRRSTAMGIYMLGTPLGITVGYLLGGLVAAQFDWRMVFFIAGVPGIVLSLLLLLTLREPVRQELITLDKPRGHADFSPLVTLRFMARSPALLFVVAGVVWGTFASGTVLAWVAPFLMRSHGFSVAEAGLAIALGYGLAGALGTVIGGILADRLGARDVRWIPGLNAITSLIIVAAGAAMLLVQDSFWCIVFLMLFGIGVSMQYGPGHGLFQSLLGAEMRGRGTAILFILIALIGAGLGPQFTGLLSDYWAASFGVDSLRYAMLTGAASGLLTAIFFLAAMRHVREGINEAGRNRDLMKPASQAKGHFEADRG